MNAFNRHINVCCWPKNDPGVVNLRVRYRESRRSKLKVQLPLTTYSVEKLIIEAASFDCALLMRDFNSGHAGFLIR